MSENTATITATVKFRLTPQGQKAAILAGKPAAIEQSITGEIPASDLDLCFIQPDGNVTANLTNGETFYADGRIGGYNVRSDFHFLSVAETAAEALSRYREMRDQFSADLKRKYELRQEEDRIKAEARAAAIGVFRAQFFADPSARLDVRHYNDSAFLPEIGECRDPELIAEAKRRNNADMQARIAAEKQAEADRQQFIREFLSAHGAPDQVERFDADLLPENELLAALTTHVFSPVADLSQYENMTSEDVHSASDIEGSELGYEAIFRVIEPDSLTADQWAGVKYIRQRLTDAGINGTSDIRLHQGSLNTNDSPWGICESLGLRVKVQFGPFELMREFAV